MKNNIRCFQLFTAVFLAATAAVPSGNAQTPAKWLRSVEIMTDPPVKGRQDFSIRMTPGFTDSYDVLKFECVYRQEYVWTNSLGKAETKKDEPVTFIYERKNIKLTNDLDSQVSFQVPVETEILRERFGKTTFKEGTPVTVNRIRISGMKTIAADSATNDSKPKLNQVWGYEVQNKTGTQIMTDKHRIGVRKETPRPKLPNGKKPKLGEINLD